MKKEQGTPSVREVVPELSERLDLAIQAALKPQAKDRPASCLEFFKLLTARAKFDDSRDSIPLPKSDAVVTEGLSGSERRAWVRHPLGVGTCGVIDTSICGGQPDSEEIWPLVVRDVSIGGIGVLLARRFEMGTELSIELSAGPDASPRRLAARVVRIVPEKAGHWIHGCMFREKLTEDELTSLLRFA